MKLHNYLKHRLKSKTPTGPQGDIVISSRVRLARNLSSSPFPWRANSSTLEKVWERTKYALEKQKEFKDGEAYYLPDLSTVDREFLIERHLISYDHVLVEGPRGVIISKDESISIMVNEEDHLRIASIRPGLDLESSAQLIDDLDNKLARIMGFAFTDHWGFLTACPTNAGTGMRASCLVHLPGLLMNNRIEPMLGELSKLGVSIRGLYGENTRVLGDIFQITNGSTLGRSENDILQTMERVVNGIISYEKTARQELLTGKIKILTEDKIFRAAAALTSARRISFKETMENISKVRLGVSIGLKLPFKEDVLNDLMIIIQPAHLQEFMGKNLSHEERDVIRAKILRQKLK